MRSKRGCVGATQCRVSRAQQWMAGEKKSKETTWRSLVSDGFGVHLSVCLGVAGWLMESGRRKQPDGPPPNGRGGM